MDPDKHIDPDKNGADQPNVIPSLGDPSLGDASVPVEQAGKGGRSGARNRADKRSAWLRKLDEECPYQVVLPRQQLTDDSEILDFLLANVGIFDMYVEDEYAAFVRYCFADAMDAEMFRARFEPKAERLKLAV